MVARLPERQDNMAADIARAACYKNVYSLRPASDAHSIDVNPILIR
jgi:hypothetical protein